MPREYCKSCNNSILTLSQLEKIKKNYNANFRKIRETVEVKYKSMFEDMKLFLMETFKREYAIVCDNHRKNKKNTRIIKNMSKASMQVLIQQELHIGGIESEYFI